MTDYSKKYLKYKMKYENLLNKINGGALVFNEFANKNTYLLKTEMEGDKVTFKKPSGKSNNFTQAQKKNLEILTQFILPEISFKGKKLGYNFIKEVETIGAGTFGTTISYDNLLIKIMIVNPEKRSVASTEIVLLEELYYKTEPPDVFNKYYGFICGKNLMTLFTFDKPYNIVDKLNLMSSIFGRGFAITKQEDIITKIKNIYDPGFVIPPDFFEDMIIAFFDKEDGDMDKFIKEFIPKLSIEDRLLLSKDFFTDIAWGLQFLHKTKRQYHSDIKSANVVYKIQDDGTIKFKLIDFGTMGFLDSDGDSTRHSGGTKFYYEHTNYIRVTPTGIRHMFTYMYDYFCTLIIVLELWGIKIDTVPDMQNAVRLMDETYKSYVDTKHNIDQTIDIFINNVSTKFGLKLPNRTANPEYDATYKLLMPFFINGNKTGGKSPKLA
jgi:hypothetical protein